MGTGTNVQKRLIAMHHLDAPWKPAEVEQRDGRILRQGNENPEVAIYRYVTERSFDSYMWQALETKARFIAQVIQGGNIARRAEDIGGQELSYAEVKAIASGNPAVLTLAEADAELQRLTILKKNHTDEQFVARRRVKDLPGTIAQLTERLEDLATDAATLKGNDGITVGDREYQDAPELLGQRLQAMPQQVNAARKISIGVYRGLRFGMVLHPHQLPEVYLEGAMTRLDSLTRQHQGPRAVLNALDRIAKDYGSEIARTKQNFAIAESQLRDYQARLGKPFEHETYLANLTELRDQLKISLSGNTEEGAPKSGELAEQIKALKQSNTVEAAPERATQRHLDAEEPVTARIRRQSETRPADLADPERDADVPTTTSDSLETPTPSLLDGSIVSPAEQYDTRSRVA
jgi:hypothetical protein